MRRSVIHEDISVFCVTVSVSSDVASNAGPECKYLVTFGGVLNLKSMKLFLLFVAVELVLILVNSSIFGGRVKLSVSDTSAGLFRVSFGELFVVVAVVTVLSYSGLVSKLTAFFLASIFFTALTILLNSVSFSRSPDAS